MVNPEQSQVTVPAEPNTYRSPICFSAYLIAIPARPEIAPALLAYALEAAWSASSSAAFSAAKRARSAFFNFANIFSAAANLDFASADFCAYFFCAALTKANLSLTVSDEAFKRCFELTKLCALGASY